MSPAACALLLASFAAVDLPARAGDLEATLRLSVPDEGAGPGRALVRIEIEVSGPAGMEVDAPRLEDAFSAWRAGRRSSAWNSDDSRVHLTLVLEQTKAGVVGLPGVVVRARPGPGGEWHELSWPDLLHDPRDGPDPDFQKELPPSSWPGLLRWIALAVLLALGVPLAIRFARRRGRPTVLPPHARALARLGGEGLRPAAHLALLDQVVREYLDERFGLHTRRHTGAELAADCAALPGAAREAVLELSRLTEPARFAGVEPREEERGRAVDLARRAIEACAALPVGQEAGEGQMGKNGGGG